MTPLLPWGCDHLEDENEREECKKVYACFLRLFRLISSVLAVVQKKTEREQE